MDSNTHSTEPPAGPGGRLTALAVAVAELAAQDLDRLPDAVLAEEVVGLRRLLDGLEGQWLRRLAAVDGRGAAGADRAAPAVSTVSWLRNRLRLSANAASGRVRTAGSLFRGPLAGAADALVGGVISSTHAKVLADGTHQLPAPVVVEAEPLLVEVAGGLDPPRLRLAVGQLCRVADPDRADRQVDHRHQRRGVWLASTWDGMVAIDGLLEPEAGHTLLAALVNFHARFGRRVVRIGQC